MKSDYDNPVYHVHNGNVPNIDIGKLTFSLLLNLASACNPDSIDILMGFIKKYEKNLDINPDSYIYLISEFAINYYNDFIKPNKNYKTPSEEEKQAIQSLKLALNNISDELSDEDIQSTVFQVGKDHNFTNLREWFLLLYQVLLGQDQGPRMGSFIKLYGINNMIELIESKINA